MLTENEGNKGSVKAEEHRQKEIGQKGQSQGVREWLCETDGRGDWSSQSFRTAVL